ncbi:CHAT domain-containing tetratricopeptide repeat protein [Reichenbachiella sp. MALMAid0571]|uniref:CHAT domain-containing protein n=1 Tax=Reichenbachiella sp. MALMAid0571 TaxID=3143939 RepID=UPI0032DE8AD9
MNKNGLLIFCLFTSIHCIAQMSGLQKNDLKNFSFALLDGQNVAMYADLGLARDSEKSKTTSGRMMTDVIFCEKNFRFGQTWMIKKQLEDMIFSIKYGEEDQFDDAQLHAFARGTNDLGIVYHHLGLFKKSEKYALWAYEIRKKRFGLESMATISSINSLASLYRDMGMYVESSKLFDQCVDLLEKIGELNSMEHAVVLNNLSTLQLVLGQPQMAVKTSDMAIGIADKFTGDKSKDFLTFLLNSTLINQDLKDYNKAEALLLNIKEVKEKRFGKKSSQYARTLNNLAALYLEKGKINEVESLLKTALDIYKKQYGENHPTTASIIGNLGLYYYTIGDYSEGLKILQRAKQVQGYILGKYHPEYITTLETLALIYWETGKIAEATTEFKLLTDGISDQVVNYFPAMNEENKTKFWDRSRNFLMKYYSFVLANHSKYPELTTNMYDLHLATKGLLLSESVKLKQAFLGSYDDTLKEKYLEWLMLKEELAKYNAMPKKSVYSLGVNLLKFTDKVNDLEKELRELSQNFAEGYAQDYSTESVQAILPTDAAAIEIIRIDLYNKRFTGVTEYVALILKNDNKDPHLVSIPDGNNLEGRNFKLYRNSIRLKAMDEVSYDAYWKPVAGYLEGVNKIYLSQDGIYNQMNINTLVKPSGESVISDLTVVFVSSTRQLSEPKPDQNHKEVVLLGNPYYGTELYAALPGTKVEVESIDAVLKAGAYSSKVLTEKLASEKSLKESVQNPGILHISTHGYFTPDNSTKNKKAFGEDVEKVVVNPLLRSGLVLAEPTGVPGQFDYLKNNNEEDGLLTAYEAMSFQLDQTDLVVLSACETGLGDMKAGEGVYGLQRAFQVAGAQAIVTSLWKVDDEATQMLMTNFYSGWLKTGNKQEAFISAQKLIKDKFKDPYYWGAFVMMN